MEFPNKCFSLSHCLLSHHWTLLRGTQLFLLWSQYRTFIHIDKIPPEPLLLWAEQDHLSLPLLMCQMLWALKLPWWPFNALKLLRESPQTREPRTGHRTPDDVFSLALSRGEGSSPFHMLAELFLMHPRMLLAFFAARLHCWLIVNLLTRVPCLFSPELLSGLSSRCASAWDDFAFPLVELHRFPTGSFLEPVKGSPEWQHNHPVCQPVLPVMCHLWICWISFWSHQWEDYMVLVPLSTNSHWSWLVTMTDFELLITSLLSPVPQPAFKSPHCLTYLTHTSPGCLWGC